MTQKYKKKPATPNVQLLDSYQLLSYDELDSTNEEAKRLAGKGAHHGAIIWARKQTSGKGRMQRSWVSDSGNLFTSILLAPECDLKTASQLSFVAAVSAIDAIEHLLPHGGELGCKWPNDIMLNGKKLGCILLESFKTKADNTQWIVVGIGINIDSCPKDVTPQATFLKDAGVEIVSAKIVLSRLIYGFTRNYDLWKRQGFTPIRRRWLKFAYKLGEPLKVKLPHEKISGIFKDIDQDGALIVGLDARRKRTVHTGDVFF